jgi:fermentation-respiration switch protein FrsA (DUF1100 family)
MVMRVRARTVLKCLVAVIVLGYAGAIALLYFKQGDFLYPSQTARTAPAAAGFAAAEELVLDTADGEKVIAWHVPPKGDRSVVLFFHGNGDFLAGRVPRFRAVTADGTGLIALSYRGYGGSSGLPSERGLLADAAAAYRLAASKYETKRIVVWGFSLGTGPAVATAAEHPVGKLVLEAPYTSTADVAASLMPVMPVRWLMRDQFRSDQRIGKVTVPLLVMHGARDPGIAIRFGEQLFALANQPKRFVRFPDGGHDDLDAHGAVETALKFVYEPTAQ